MGLERGHRTLTVIRKGRKVATIPLAPRTARAIDLAIGERTDGPLFLTGDGRPPTGTAPPASSAGLRAAPGSPRPSGRVLAPEVPDTFDHGLDSSVVAIVAVSVRKAGSDRLGPHTLPSQDLGVRAGQGPASAYLARKRGVGTLSAAEVRQMTVREFTVMAGGTAQQTRQPHPTARGRRVP
jgi:hypothetical protein